MRFWKSILTCSCFLAAFQGVAQIPIVPDQFRVNLEAKEIQKTMKFYQVNYRTSTVDLREIKKLVDEDIPDSVVIVPPNLKYFDHVVVLVGFVEGDASSMVIWLAGNYNYRNITFFVDQEQDRDFTNDVDPIRMKAGDSQRGITLRQDGVDRNFGLPSLKLKYEGLKNTK